MSKPKLILVGGEGYCKSCIDVIDPDYALAILLRAKIPAKHEASQLFLNHRSGNYASFVKVHILLGF